MASRGAQQQWSIPLARLVERFGGSMDQTVRRATYAVFVGATNPSPVDTGRFRANWNVSQGSPDLSTTASTQAARMTAEVQRALQFKAGGVVYLANGLPYAVALEYGSSKQAPLGMVRVAAQNFAAHVARSAVKP